MNYEEISKFNDANKIDCWPGNIKKVKAVFDSQPLEFVKEYYQFWKQEYEVRKKKGGYGCSSLHRSVAVMEKYIRERGLGIDVSYQKLIAQLEDILSKFKDTYIGKVKGFAEKQYEWALKLNSWNELDWIADSFTQTTHIRCGYLQCAVVPYKAANGQTIWVNFCSVLGRYEVRNLKEVDPTASYIYYNVSGKGKTNIIVRSPELAEARMCDSEKLETPARPIPSKRQKLFKNIEGTTKFAINGKEIWVEQALKDAEDKFKADIRVLANKIRERSINEENLSLLYASDDPKHIQISISDGNITLYARSIFAAANSILLSPHFRFIVTETSKTK